MADLSIYETLDGGDVVLEGNDLQLVESIFNLPYLALFGGNVEQSTPVDIEENGFSERFDYWGNQLFYRDSVDLQYNSAFERTLDKVALNSAGLQELTQVGKEDLSFLSEIGEVDFSVSLDGNDKVRVDILVTEKATLNTRSFVLLWNGTRLEEIVDSIKMFKATIEPTELTPPVNLIILDVTSNSVKVSATSTTTGVEISFEWEISESSDFSVISDSGFSTSGVNNPEFLFTGLDYLTNYNFRVRANGIENSDWSIVSSVTTIIDGNIFNNVWAHLRSDSYIDSNGNSTIVNNTEYRNVVTLVDLSSNDRNIGEQLLANEYALVSKSGDRNLDGYPCITFDIGGETPTPKPHLTNNSNWAGLFDNYTVVMVINNSWIGNNVRYYYAKNNPNAIQRAHAYRNGSSASARTAEMQVNFGGDNILFSKSNTTQVDAEAVMIKYSSSGLKMWVNGIEVVATSDLSGQLTEDFSSIILGNTSGLNFSANRIRIYDMLFINDIPENQPEKINDYFTQYLGVRYPSLGIVSPNL